MFGSFAPLLPSAIVTRGLVYWKSKKRRLGRLFPFSNWRYSDSMLVFAGVQLLCLFMFFFRGRNGASYHSLSTTLSLFVLCLTKGMLIVIFIGFQHAFSCFFENNSYKDAYQKLDIIAGNPQIWPKYVQLGTHCMHLYEFWIGVIPFLFCSCFFWKDPAEIPLF